MDECGRGMCHNLLHTSWRESLCEREKDSDIQFPMNVYIILRGTIFNGCVCVCL
jgi:hypothetical protein